MKTIFKIKVLLAFTYFFLCISCKAPAQTAGSYITNNTMSAFHGTWQWTSGTDTVRVYLKTYPVFYNVNGGFTWDNLVGWYYYKRGNQILYSNYNVIGNTVSESLIKGGNENISQNKVDAFFKDPLKDKTISVSLMLNASQNEIKWRASEIGVIRATGPLPTPGMTLPKNMILSKL